MTLTFTELASYKIAETAKNAMIHGINTRGIVVAFDATPDYGGNGTDEDFDTDNGAFNVYCPQIDGWDDRNEPLMPAIMVNVETRRGVNTTLEGGVDAALIMWEIHLSDNFGQVTVNGTAYQNEAAASIYKDRLMEVVERLKYPDVNLIEFFDAEPLEFGKVEPENNFEFVSGASQYIEYIKEM